METQGQPQEKPQKQAQEKPQEQPQEQPQGKQGQPGDSQAEFLELLLKAAIRAAERGNSGGSGSRSDSAPSTTDSAPSTTDSAPSTSSGKVDPSKDRRPKDEKTGEEGAAARRSDSRKPRPPFPKITERPFASKGNPLSKALDFFKRLEEESVDQDMYVLPSFLRCVVVKGILKNLTSAVGNVGKAVVELVRAGDHTSRFLGTLTAAFVLIPVAGIWGALRRETTSLGIYKVFLDRIEQSPNTQRVAGALLSLWYAQQVVEGKMPGPQDLVGLLQTHLTPINEAITQVLNRLLALLPQ